MCLCLIFKLSKGAHLKFAMSAILHIYATVSQSGLDCGKYGCESSNICWWCMCVWP